ncbi:competence/damage-inducible protein A [Desulfobacterales bacterium HSG16]|nr:competence/damage-inducible protein A [Desulfobacterales bacterium HSG16]
MKSEILATGDEIRSGALIDSNSAYIAQHLERCGVTVLRHHCVGDELQILTEALIDIAERARIAVVTGGLGPTIDDVTTQAAADAVGKTTMLDQKALDSIEDFFKSRDRSMSSSNKKQAMLPEGADPLYNPVGTAPGFCLDIKGCLFFFLPGVPYEMKKMLKEQVLPRLKAMQGDQRRFCKVKTISTFGLPESTTGERVEEISDIFPELRLGLRASFPDIQIKLYAEGTDENHLNQQIDKAAKWVLDRMGKKAFSVDGETMEAVAGRLLKKKHATIAVAESCTGGLIAHQLTNVAGSSDYFQFSGITYSNESKIRVLGVNPDTIEKYGAVHEETAKEMAMGAKKLVGADFGLSTSGIAGPTGGSDDKPVGTVCIGLATPEDVFGYRFFFPFPSRSMNKSIFAMTALDILRRSLL